MLKQAERINLNRIIDANINRAKEGLRVCEDITRFILDNRQFTSALKRIRHRLSFLSDSLMPKALLLKERSSVDDVGRFLKADELKRSGIGDIFLANIQRAKESIRVLEECSKLINVKAALGFKELRYKTYEIEKKVLERI
ncbi:MAG: thiamine-phosphate pyrophosphorylase [Candidatus Omnitrophica bacterium]|nr:thiamine-phosphate pyrophosphorylase [Candidatus Omnitrophota bacterium]MDD5665131.1 thiamine-phosphate pyrophosphorylase [Candidatus Omnitrophota bacterium]